eukprot:Sro224_g091570.1 leucine rich repeat (1252) ;mRNA; r:21503-25532
MHMKNQEDQKSNTDERQQTELSEVRDLAREWDQKDREAKRAARQARTSITRESMRTPATGTISGSDDGSNDGTVSSSRSQKDREAKRAARRAGPSTACSSVLAGSDKSAEVRTLTRELEEKDRAAKEVTRQQQSAPLLDSASRRSSTNRGLGRDKAAKDAARQQQPHPQKPPSIDASSRSQSTNRGLSRRAKESQNNIGTGSLASRESTHSGISLAESTESDVSFETSRSRIQERQNRAAKRAEKENQLKSRTGAWGSADSTDEDVAASSEASPCVVEPTPEPSAPGAFHSQPTQEEIDGIQDPSQSSHNNDPDPEAPAIPANQDLSIEVLVEATLVDDDPPPISQMDESDKPMAEAKAMDDNEMASSFLRSQTGRRLIAGVLFVFLMLIIGLAVGLSRQDSNGAMEVTMVTITQVPSATPTMSPTLAPTALLETELAQVLLNELSLTNATIAEILQNHLSPPAQAASWLLNEPFLFGLPLLQKVQGFTLGTLFWSTDGASWTNSTNWFNYELSSTVCSWHQIGCDVYEEEVDSINLGNNKLHGTIPREIALLAPSLTSIEFYDNALLQLLRVQNSLLSGSIAPDLALATSLSGIDLTGNNLVSSIPRGLFHLPMLSQLNLAKNALSSSIPSEVGLSNSIVGLNLSSNLITGSIPSKIFSISSLAQLDLSANGLFGSLPEEVGSASQLSFMHIGTNQITGKLPSSLGLLRKLCFIDASNNQMVGSLSEALFALCYGETLEIPAENGTTTVVLRGTLLAAPQYDTEDLLAQLNDAASDILSNGFNGFESLNTTIVSIISPYQSEIKLSIAVSGDSPPSQSMVRNVLFPFNSFQFNYVWDSTTTIPIFVMPEFVQPLMLDVSGNSLTGSLHSGFFESIPWVNSFNIASNHFSGTLPTQLGTASSIVELSLAANNFVGSLPSEIGQLTDMQALDLSFNDLSSTIPLEFGSLASLRSLAMSSNSLVGPLDSLFWKEQLQANSTVLGNDNDSKDTGFGQQLCHLDLSDNALSGTLPLEVGTLLCRRHLYAGNKTVSMAFRIQYGFHDWQQDVARMPYDSEMEAVRKQTSRFLSDFISGQFHQSPGHVELVALNASLDSTLEGENRVFVDFVAAVRFDEAPIPTRKDLVDALSEPFALLDYVTISYLGELTGSLFDINNIASNARFIYLDVPPTSLLPPVSLDVSFNNLAGTIPSELANLMTLHSSVVLEGNAFTGSLPVELCPWLCLEQSGSSSQPLLVVDCDQVECNCDCSADQP